MPKEKKTKQDDWVFPSKYWHILRRFRLPGFEWFMTFGYYFFFSTKKVEKMIVPPCDPHGLGSTLCTLTGPRVQCAAVFVYLHHRHYYLTKWCSGVEKGPLDQGTGGSTTDTGATVALFRISNYIKYVLRLATQSFKLTEHSPGGASSGC